MEDCLFCKIVKGEIPSEKVYEDEEILAFKDIHPKAPVHLLIIPKKHIDSMKKIEKEDEALIGKIFMVIKELAEQAGLKDGYRIVNNCEKDGGQEVMHLHFHLLGGKELGLHLC